MNRLVLGVGLGITISALLCGAFVAGRASNDSSTAEDVVAATTTTTVEEWPDARLHAYAACVAEHRPSQISYDHRRAVTENEIDDAQFDALAEAEEAAALDPKWRPLADALIAKHAAGSVSGPPGPQMDAQFDARERAFAALRAQCLLTGAGDINEANLVPDEAPPDPGTGRR